LRLFRLVRGNLPGPEQRWGSLATNASGRLDRLDDALRHFAFAVPDDGALQAIIARGPVLEIGAGSGYWAALLRQRGLDVLAIDKYRSRADPLGRAMAWTEVLPGGPEVAAAHPGRSLLLCWPPYDAPIAAQALGAYRGSCLIYIGAPRGGATATGAFFDALDSAWRLVERLAIPRWHRQHDDLTVWLRRKPTGRPGIAGPGVRLP
jgi:hypothetical protein